MIENNKELWATIKEAPIYSISNHGKVRNNLTQTILRSYAVNKWGHQSVNLRYKRKDRRRLVHRLVLTEFVGNCPKNMETRHLDGNPLNNYLGNLCWGTRRENGQDSVRHGTAFLNRKLTAERVKQIRHRYSMGKQTMVEISIDFGLSLSMISRIINKNRWRNVSDAKNLKQSSQVLLPNKRIQNELPKRS